MAEIVTGEAVPLDLTAAGFPSRIAALLIDMVVQLVLYVIILTVVGIVTSHNASFAAAASALGYVAVFIAYPTTFETLSRGKTLGKLALGLRVVGDDGSPVRFRQAFVRALAGIIEIWSVVLAPVGLITSLVSHNGKRVGDIFAGTYVITERVPTPRVLAPVYAAVPPPLAEWARSLQVDSLTDQTAEDAAGYLRRIGELSPAARDTLGLQLASAVATQVSPPPPPGTPPAAYLSAVLAVRRQKTMAWSVAAPPRPPDWAAPRPVVTPFPAGSPAARPPAPVVPQQPFAVPEPAAGPAGLVPPA